MRCRISKCEPNRVDFEMWGLTLETLGRELLDLIGQFLGVVCSLDKKWTRALLRRAQLSNPRFLGEMLSSFQLISSSLKHSTPLPWMSNPLLERFLKPTAVVMAQHSYGYDISLDKDQVSLLFVAFLE